MRNTCKWLDARIAILEECRVEYRYVAQASYTNAA